MHIQCFTPIKSLTANILFTPKRYININTNTHRSEFDQKCRVKEKEATTKKPLDNDENVYIPFLMLPIKEERKKMIIFHYQPI